MAKMYEICNLITNKLYWFKKGCNFDIAGQNQEISTSSFLILIIDFYSLFIYSDIIKAVTILDSRNKMNRLTAEHNANFQ